MALAVRTAAYGVKEEAPNGALNDFDANEEPNGGTLTPLWAWCENDVALKVRAAADDAAVKEEAPQGAMNDVDASEEPCGETPRPLGDC